MEIPGGVNRDAAFPLRGGSGGARVARADAAARCREPCRTVATFCEKPGVQREKAGEKILHYVLRTLDKGITYGGQPHHGNEMVAFAELRYLPGHRTVGIWGGSYARGERDQLALVRPENYIKYLGVGVREVVGVVKEVLFLRQVRVFMMPTIENYPIVMKEDNEGVIKMANSKHGSWRTRHIDVKNHVVRDAVEAERSRSITWKRKTSTRAYSPSR